jgi:hypothetical protein
MDLFNGPVGSNQVHDFSPGIPPSGLFWTQAIAQDSVEVRLGDGAASLHATNLPEKDAHTLLNALTGGPTVPSTVSFDMTWTGQRPLMDVTDAVHGFTGSFMFSAVAIDWSAQEAGFSFVSDPAGTTSSVAAVMGRERNGVFFSG